MTDPFLIQPDSPKPTRIDAIKNRTLLIETARQLFGEQGVEAVTMSAIAEKAMVGKGTLYRHFENKNELCRALLDEDMRQLQNNWFQQSREVHDPVENLFWFIDAVFNFVCEHVPLLCGATGGEINLTHPAHWWWRQTILTLLERIGVPEPIDYKADTLYMMLDVRTFYLQHSSLGYSTEQIRRGLHTVIQSFLHRPPA